jgi:hypothetical protein
LLSAFKKQAVENGQGLARGRAFINLGSSLNHKEYHGAIIAVANSSRQVEMNARRGGAVFTHFTIETQED